MRISGSVDGGTPSTVYPLNVGVSCIVPCPLIEFECQSVSRSLAGLGRCARGGNGGAVKIKRLFGDKGINRLLGRHVILWIVGARFVDFAELRIDGDSGQRVPEQLDAD